MKAREEKFVVVAGKASGVFQLHRLRASGQEFQIENFK
jgi:hypothetical protein